MIRLLIADDHATIRLGLERLFRGKPGIDIVGLAADGEAAVGLAEREHPDVVLMDMQMPGIDGVEATRRILAISPGTKVIAFTSFAGPELIQRAIGVGAAGYLLKDAAPDELLGAVRSVVQGGAPLAPAVAGAVLARSPSSRTTKSLLSRREAEVLALIATGLRNKEVADQLGLSEGTVRSHLTHIFRRLSVTSRGQACLWAERNGLLDDRAGGAPGRAG